MKLYISYGTVHYEKDKLIVEVDSQLAKYYYDFVPKYIRINKQRYDAHISVVRNEIPPKLEYWNKYEGEIVEFFYEPYVYNGEVYYWLNVFCNRLEEIRAELGLEVSSEYTRPPGAFIKCFHITVGNTKAF